MFHESLKKQFNWNLIFRCTVKLTLNYYFMKYSERKISQCVLPLKGSKAAAHVVFFRIKLFKGKDTLRNISFRAFHEMQFQGHFMKHEIL